MSNEIADRAQALLQVNRGDEALAILGPGLAESPGDQRLLRLTSWAYGTTGRPQQAVEAALQAISLGPENSQNYIQASIAYRVLGNAKQALEMAECAVRHGPGLWSAHVQVALSVAMLRSRYRLGLQAARRAVDLAPEEADAYYALGVVHVRFARLKKGRQAFERALSLNPSHATALNDMAVAQMMPGRMTKAAEYLQASAVANPRLEAPSHNMNVLVSALVAYIMMVVLAFFLVMLFVGDRMWPLSGLVIGRVIVVACVGAMLSYYWRLPAGSRALFRRLLLRDRLSVVRLFVLLAAVVAISCFSLRVPDAGMGGIWLAGMVLLISSAVITRLNTRRLRRANPTRVSRNQKKS